MLQQSFVVIMHIKTLWKITRKQLTKIYKLLEDKLMKSHSWNQLF